MRKFDHLPWGYNGPEHAAKLESMWTVKSGCHFSCMDQAKGIQIISSTIDNTNNIQLCSPQIMVGISQFFKLSPSFLTRYNPLCSLVINIKPPLNILRIFVHAINSKFEDCPDMGCKSLQAFKIQTEVAEWHVKMNISHIAST